MENETSSDTSSGTGLHLGPMLMQLARQAQVSGNLNAASILETTARLLEVTQPKAS